MPQTNAVSDHYTSGNLLTTITDALATIGKSPDAVTVEDLAPVSEFHIGGRPATVHLLDQLNPRPTDHQLDVGCGVGGPARYVSSAVGCRVTGIDLTPEFVETGNVMCSWVGLDSQVTLEQGSALELPFESGTFDGGYMLHVGMNIADKAKLFAEVYRVLKSGASFGVYDVMRVGDGDLGYPVPWATVAETSFVDRPERYKSTMQAAGFTIVAEENRREFALATAAAQRAQNEERGGPPAMGIHTLVGPSIGLKVKNMMGGIAGGVIAPVEIIGSK